MTAGSRIAMLAAALAIGWTPVPAAPVHDADTRRIDDVGVRKAAGDGVDAREAYLRWSSPFLERTIVEPFLPAGGTARWEIALSYWRADNDDATVFAAGPTLEYPLTAARWRLTVGVQPTLFSDYASENRDLGGPLEFTSHVGTRWRAHARWHVGARIQHTSNAGIYGTNPGVDLFAVELGARF